MLWGILALAAAFFELLPAHYPAGVFSLWNFYKAIIFLSLGCMAPLAFWRFDSLNNAVLFSAVSAVLIEVLQAAIGNGHRFSFPELATKLIVICSGVCLGLIIRCLQSDRH